MSQAILLKEVYTFKTKKFSGKKFNAELQWEVYKETRSASGQPEPLLPVNFSIDIEFKINLNSKKINIDFPDTNMWYTELSKQLSERIMTSRVRGIIIPDFVVLDVVYLLPQSMESDNLKALNPKKSKYKFGYTINIIAKDQQKEYTQKEIEEVTKKILFKFDDVLKDTEYFKITK